MNIELIKEKVRLVKLSHEGKSIIEIFMDLNFVIGYLDDNYPYINETKGCNIKTTKLRAVLLNPSEYLLDDDIFEKYIDLSFEQLASELGISTHLVMLKFNNLSNDKKKELEEIYINNYSLFNSI